MRFRSRTHTWYILSNDLHAKCAYCGTTESYDWKTSAINYRLYCSNDCKRAGELPNFLCGLLIELVFVMILWSGFGGLLSFSNVGLTLILFTILLTLPFVIAVYIGLKARARISKRLEPDEVYC